MHKKSDSPFTFTKSRWLIVVFAVLMGACSHKTSDYTIFPVKSVLTGEMKDGDSMYLVRTNEEKNMTGTGFVYTGSAVVDTFSFVADTLGNFRVHWGEQIFQSKATVKEKHRRLIVELPYLPGHGIKKQKLKLDLESVLPEYKECVERYNEPVFDSIVSIKDVQYGQTMGYYTSKPVDKVPHGDNTELFKIIVKKIAKTMKGQNEVPLLMDVYMPYNDTIKARPVYLYLHGGAFFFGDKENLLQQRITEHLVKRGYVVASINYRLGCNMLGLDAVERTIYSGVQDARAAIRYLKHHSQEFGIDPDQIYLAGSSAGGIIALTSAFMEDGEVFESAKSTLFRGDLGGLNESGNELQESTDIAGLIALWGAITDLSIIDPKDAYFPTLMFHGTSDDVVYCSQGLPFQQQINNRFYNSLASSWQLYGSAMIYDHMRDLNMPVQYVPFEGHGHEPQVNPDGTYNDNMEIINTNTVDFLFHNVSNAYFPCYLDGLPEIYHTDFVPTYSLTGEGIIDVSWHVDGGCIIGQSENSVQVVWFSGIDTGEITACVTNAQGLSKKKKLEVKINEP